MKPMVFMSLPKYGIGYIVLPCSVTSVLPSCHSVIISFPIIISTKIAHIQLKFDTWMCIMNIQVEIEFGSVPLIVDRVMPYELRNK